MRFLAFIFLAIATAVPHGIGDLNMYSSVNLKHKDTHHRNHPMMMSHYQQRHQHQIKSLTNGTTNNNSTGNAIVQNSCSFPLYLWTVGSSTSPQKTITAYSQHREPFRHDVRSGGVALKITTQPNGIFTGMPQTVFAYNLNLNASAVWYDLSDVFGDPFEGSQVALEPASPQIRWADGVPPRGSQVRVVDAKQDLKVTFC